jgi:hypothetical protein
MEEGFQARAFARQKLFAPTSAVRRCVQSRMSHNANFVGNLCAIGLNFTFQSPCKNHET